MILYIYIQSVDVLYPGQCQGRQAKVFLVRPAFGGFQENDPQSAEKAPGGGVAFIAIFLHPTVIVLEKYGFLGDITFCRCWSVAQRHFLQSGGVGNDIVHAATHERVSVRGAADEKIVDSVVACLP